MRKRGKHKKKRFRSKNNIRLFFMAIIIIFVCILIRNISKNNDSAYVVSLSNEIFSELDTSTYANIDTYIIYGTHFNLEGYLEIREEDYSVENAVVVVKNLSGEEIEIDTDYSFDDNQLTFSTIDEINTGLDLESLEVTDYFILLKLELQDDEVKYYSLSNDTEYGDLEYYTLTRNNQNNKIDVKFTTVDNLPFLLLNIETVSELPEDVYDVVIDPGHGGNNGGAVSGEYIESEIVLDCAYELKSQLEALGLKVLLTRDGTESPEEYTAYNIYDEDGRVTIANESHAKILISLHLNSNESDAVSGGVEVYASPNCDLTLAKMLADNIVETANTDYSGMESYREIDGVYIRTIELGEYKDILMIDGYNGIFDTIPYLFIIREIGGIATGAYADGTSSYYSENIYRNSNVGVEGYLIELGYMNVDEDLYNILENSDLYMQAIADSINEFYNIT